MDYEVPTRVTEVLKRYKSGQRGTRNLPIYSKVRVSDYIQVGIVSPQDNALRDIYVKLENCS